MHGHRYAVIAALLIAGCASSGANHDLGILIFETVSDRGGAAITSYGAHLLRVEFENRSHQDIVVHTVTIEPADPDLFTNDAPQDVELLVGPGTKQYFNMPLTVSSSGRSRIIPRDILQDVKVTLSCSAAETGDFIAGGTYSVNHVALGQ